MKDSTYTLAQTHEDKAPHIVIFHISVHYLAFSAITTLAQFSRIQATAKYG